MSSRPTGNPIPLSTLSSSSTHASGSEHPTDQSSIGDLVREASVHVSTLVRAEIALAKSEVFRDGKRIALSIAFIVAALVILLYSSFFFFFFLGWLLMEWIPGWAAFGIVFLLMLAAVIGIGIVTFLVLRRVSPPEKTLKSVKDLKDLIPQRDTAQSTPTT